MKGAIFFSTKRGSTAQYAHWIAEATDLPVFNITDPVEDPTKYDFLILGSAILFYKPTIRKWLNTHLKKINDKPIIFFTVSGAGPSQKLDRWLKKSLPKPFTSKMQHVALRGRMDPKQLSWGMQLIMRMGAFLNPDPKASKEERYGFDYMDQTSIDPIIELVDNLKLKKKSA